MIVALAVTEAGVRRCDISTETVNNSPIVWINQAPRGPAAAVAWRHGSVPVRPRFPRCEVMPW
jgi:hypothetical protein